MLKLSLCKLYFRIAARFIFSDETNALCILLHTPFPLNALQVWCFFPCRVAAIAVDSRISHKNTHFFSFYQENMGNFFFCGSHRD